MKVKEIVIEWLKSHNCDGLCREGCGCGLDDLAPCDDVYRDCVAAKAVKCKGKQCRDYRDCDYGDEASVCYRPARIKK